MLLSAAASQGVINATVHANMTAIVVLSMVLTPLFLIVRQRFARSSGANLDGVESVADGEALCGNVLIIGFGRVGQIASQAPIAYGAQISIIDSDPDVVHDAGKYGFKVYYGDGTREDVLHAAGAYHADCVLVCVDDAAATTRIVENLEHGSPTAKTIVRAIDRRHALALAKADYFVRETFEAAVSMGEAAVKMLGADDAEAAEISTQVRQVDRERFALENTGGDFAGAALLLSNNTAGKSSH